ncbi:MAG TPA: hypothetical protein VIH08_14055 [Blastococcus sp.]
MSVVRFDPFGDPFRSLDRLASQLVSGARTPGTSGGGGAAAESS